MNHIINCLSSYTPFEVVDWSESLYSKMILNMLLLLVLNILKIFCLKVFMI